MYIANGGSGTKRTMLMVSLLCQTMNFQWSYNAFELWKLLIAIQCTHFSLLPFFNSVSL